MKVEIVDFDARGRYLAARTVAGPGDDDCWLWSLKPDRDGYGVAHHRGRQWRAHRLSYTHHVGAIPDGLELDHICEERRCVRPSHLEPVTNFENFVRKYLRQDRPRESAEQLARYDIESIELANQKKVAMRAAQVAKTVAEQAAEVAGAGLGSLVRRGRSRGAATWIVREVIAGERGNVYLHIRSVSSSHEMLVTLESVIPT